MGILAAGQVVIVHFPFSDLTATKLRPAVVPAEAGRGRLDSLPDHQQTLRRRQGHRFGRAGFRARLAPAGQLHPSRQTFHRAQQPCYKSSG